MDVIVTGRHCTISDEFRSHVEQRLHSVERLRDRITRVDVQVSADPHVKHGEQGVQCEITLRSKGPVVRAMATADEKHVAFDGAMDHLMTQLRKAADRRKSHRGLRIGEYLGSQPETPSLLVEPPVDAEAPQTVAGDVQMQGDGPLVVREKRFAGTPLTLAQALDEMELVGHDFFLYVDADSQAPSVVYRRKGYDYGVIHLDVETRA